MTVNTSFEGVDVPGVGVDEVALRCLRCLDTADLGVVVIHTLDKGVEVGVGRGNRLFEVIHLLVVNDNLIELVDAVRGFALDP